MSECHEIDGPPRAWFFDGKDMRAYITIALSAKHPIDLLELSTAFFGYIDKIKARSDLIVWRRRPGLKYSYHTEIKDTETPDQYWAERYAKDEAEMTYRCRLVCYPPLTPEELEALPVKGLDDPVQIL